MANRVTLQDAVVTALDHEEYSKIESELSENEGDSSESDSESYCGDLTGATDITLAVWDEEVCYFIFLDINYSYPLVLAATPTQVLQIWI